MEEWKKERGFHEGPYDKSRYYCTFLFSFMSLKTIETINPFQTHQEKTGKKPQSDKVNLGSVISQHTLPEYYFFTWK